MRRKMKKPLAFLMAVLMMLSVMGVQVLAENVQPAVMQSSESTEPATETTEMGEPVESEVQKTDAEEPPPESEKVTEEGAGIPEEGKDEEDTQEEQKDTQEGTDTEKKADSEEGQETENLTEVKDAQEEENSRETSAEIPGVETSTEARTGKVTVVPDINTYAAVSVSIKDEILTSGSLTAQVSGTTAQDQITYQWQVYENRQWKDIEDTATVDSQKQSYEVARDGAQKTFRMKVTVNGATTVYSSGFKVNYYDKLQNGSFETPDVAESGTLSYNNAHFIQVANGTSGLYWKTTAKGAYFSPDSKNDYYMEIADGSSDYYGDTQNNPKQVYNIGSASHGDQFAELNCETPGALYQDVLTEPGTVLHWGLEHAGRWGTDTMAVIISDTKSLSADWNPAGSGFDPDNKDVQAVLADEQAKWTYHYGDYTVPAGQYVTRFYFVAVAAANGNLSNGNLLDNISFGKDLPNPPAKTGNLMITKQVEGIDAAQVPDESFTFQIKKGNEVVEEVKLPQNGQWSASLQAIQLGDYTVTETAQELDGYQMEQTLYNTGSGNQTGRTAQVTVAKEQTATVTYTNQYQQKTKVLTVSKTVDGNMGNKEEQFSFSLILQNNGEAYTSELSYEDSQGTQNHLRVDAAGLYHFQLKHGQQIRIQIPTGYEYTVSEVQEAGYKTSVNGNNASQFSGVLNEDTLAAFVNTKNAEVPPTGVRTSGSSALLLEAAGVAGGALLLFLRRKKKQGEQ